MKISIFTVTYWTYVYELVHELDSLIYEVNNHFSNWNFKISIIIRTLPNNLEKKSLFRYYQKENDLTIDFSVSISEYEKLLKTEQRYYLWKEILSYLEKILKTKKFLENNPTFDFYELKNFLIKWWKKVYWFLDEIDYTRDLF